MSCYLMKNRIGASKGKVQKMFISQKEKSQRTLMRRIVVDKDGVWEDKFYGKDPHRSVLITSIDSYNLAKDKKVEKSDIREKPLSNINFLS